MLSTIGLPGTNGFVGEFLVLIGTYAEHPVLAIISTTGVIFAAVYGLRALQRLLFERGLDETKVTLADLSMRERAVMGVFAVAMLWLGFAPQSILRRSDSASRSVIEAARFAPNAAAVSAKTSVTP